MKSNSTKSYKLFPKIKFYYNYRERIHLLIVLNVITNWIKQLMLFYSIINNRERTAYEVKVKEIEEIYEMK